MFRELHGHCELVKCMLGSMYESSSSITVTSLNRVPENHNRQVDTVGNFSVGLMSKHDKLIARETHVDQV